MSRQRGGKVSKVRTKQNWQVIINKGKKIVLNRPRDKRITEESLEDEGYTLFIDSEEEESDDSYYTDIGLLTDGEELVTMRDKMKQGIRIRKRMVRCKGTTICG